MMDDCPDTNNNGIPDAFEYRPTITEILNPVETATIIVEFESRPRPPRQGEIYLDRDEFKRASFDYGSVGMQQPYEAFIVKRFLAWLPVGRPTGPVA